MVHKKTKNGSERIDKWYKAALNNDKAKAKTGLKSKLIFGTKK